MANSYDVIVIGGGHNGLVNAAYLARAGKKVLAAQRDGWRDFVSAVGRITGIEYA